MRIVRNSGSDSKTRMNWNLIPAVLAGTLASCAPISYRLVDKYDPVIDDGLTRYYEDTLAFVESGVFDEQSGIGDGSRIAAQHFFGSQSIRLRGLLLRAQSGDPVEGCEISGKLRTKYRRLVEPLESRVENPSNTVCKMTAEPENSNCTVEILQLMHAGHECIRTRFAAIAEKGLKEKKGNAAKTVIQKLKLAKEEYERRKEEYDRRKKEVELAQYNLAVVPQGEAGSEESEEYRRWQHELDAAVNELAKAEDRLAAAEKMKDLLVAKEKEVDEDRDETEGGWGEVRETKRKEGVDQALMSVRNESGPRLEALSAGGKELVRLGQAFEEMAQTFVGIGLAFELSKRTDSDAPTFSIFGN